MFKEGYAELEGLLAETRSFLDSVKPAPATANTPWRRGWSFWIDPGGRRGARNETAGIEERAPAYTALAEGLEKFKGSIIIDPNHRILKPTADALSGAALTGAPSSAAGRTWRSSWTGERRHDQGGFHQV